MRSLLIWTSPTPRDSRSPSRRAGQRTRRDQAPLRLGSWGLGNVVRVVSILEGPVDRSLRRRGQLLVVVGALLGALIGAALGLIVEDAQTSTAVAAPGHARGAALAASSPNSHPPASRAAGSGDGSDSSSNRVARPTRQAAWERSQGPGRRPGQVRRPRKGQARQGQRQQQVSAACPASPVTADDKDPKNVVSNARCQPVAAVTAH
jgi:hypothetical protein